MTDPVRPVGRLVELAVTDLGIIDHLSLVLGPGMTALTGETGAGKTMVVGAIDLLLGGRADASVVRAGAREAVVEGRFELDGEELILTRIVPADGRGDIEFSGRIKSLDPETRSGVVILTAKSGGKKIFGMATLHIRFS